MELKMRECRMNGCICSCCCCCCSSIVAAASKSKSTNDMPGEMPNNWKGDNPKKKFRWKIFSLFYRFQFRCTFKNPIERKEAEAATGAGKLLNTLFGQLPTVLYRINLLCCIQKIVKMIASSTASNSLLCSIFPHSKVPIPRRRSRADANDNARHSVVEDVAGTVETLSARFEPTTASFPCKSPAKRKAVSSKCQKGNLSI